MLSFTAHRSFCFPGIVQSSGWKHAPGCCFPHYFPNYLRGHAVPQILPALRAALDIEVCWNLAEELEEPESMRAFGTAKSPARETGAIGGLAP